MWAITKLGKNHYKITEDSKFIEFKLISAFLDDEIVFNNNMSDDNIIFVNNPYPTPDTDNNTVIGIAYKYNGKTCVERCLVDASIIFSNMSLCKSKFVLETECK